MANNLPDNTEILDLDVGDLGDIIHNDDGKPKKQQFPRKKRYVSAIRCLRRTLGEHGVEVRNEDRVDRSGAVLRTTHTRPVLPQQDDVRIRVVGLRLHANLRDGSQANVTLIIRRDNLYLLGYRLRVGQPNGIGPPRSEAWTLNNRYLSGQEILPRPSDQPEQSDSLEQYGVLRSVAAEHSEQHQSHSEQHQSEYVYLGRQALTNAVTMLVDPESRPEFQNLRPIQRQARALLTFCFMISEAARFEPVLEHVEMGWGSEPTRVEDWVWDLVTRWRELSRDVLQYDACVDRPRPEPVKKPDEYAWKPKKLKIKKDVLLRIDPTKKKEFENSKGDAVVEIEVRTAAEMLSYLGILLLGSLTVENLKKYPLRKGKN